MRRRLAPLRARPHAGALEWVRFATGALRVVHAEYLPGGRSHSNFRIDLDGGTLPSVVLRRWLRPGWAQEEPEYDVTREVAVLTTLAADGYPAPRVIATDPDGRHCGAPALLVTHLPGAKVTDRVSRNPAFTSQLAAVLNTLHQITPTSADVPGHEWFIRSQDLGCPRRSRQPDLWDRAFDLRSRPPPGPTALLHRDFHPGNTLWVGTRLAGVVDWTQASVGHPDVDVGHMYWNLLLDCSPTIARTLTTDYRDVAGRSLDPAWQVLALVDLSDWPFTRSDLAKVEPALKTALTHIT